MPLVIYREINGDEYRVEVPLGATIMEGSVQNDIPGILAECGGSCMCATCHVYIDETFLELLPEPEEEENEMLEGVAAERKDTSRLGCQVRITRKLEGMIVNLPERQI